MSGSSPIFERRDTPTRQSGCGCCCRNSSKVAPQEGTYPGYDIVQVRPNCYVRVRHINPVPRDDAFQEEMQIEMQQHKARLKAKQGVYNKLFKSHQSSQKTKNTHGGSGDSLTQLGNIEDLTTEETPHDSTPEAQHRLTRTATSVKVQIKNQNSMSPTRQLTTKSRQSSANRNAAGASQSRVSDVPLFFIHGVGGSADVWQAQIEYFGNEGYEVIAPDMIGHGFSSAPDKAAAYHFDAISEDLLMIFDLYCKPVNIVIGHSYGASFAAVVCHHRSNRVKKMVLISGGSPTPLAPQPGLFSLPACFLSCCRPILSRGFTKSAFKDPSKSFIPSERAFDVPSYVLRHMMCGQSWLEGNADYHERYVRCPTLIVHGEEDALVSVEEEQEMEETLRNCISFILPDASHMVMLERPDKVNALIHEFVTMETGSATVITRPPSAHRKNSVLSLRSVKSIPNGLLIHNLKS